MLHCVTLCYIVLHFVTLCYTVLHYVTNSAENTALHLLLGLVTNDLPAQLVKCSVDPKTVS